MSHRTQPELDLEVVLEAEVGDGQSSISLNKGMEVRELGSRVGVLNL